MTRTVRTIRSILAVLATLAVLAPLTMLGSVVQARAVPTTTSMAVTGTIWQTDGACLDSNTNREVYMLDCNGGNFQNWTYTPDTTGTIKNKSTSFCLDSDTDFNVYTHPCNGGTFQNWTISYRTDVGKFSIKNEATFFCLESYYERVRTSNCDDEYPDQRWAVS